MSIGRRIAGELERTIYAIAGLPIAIHGASRAPSASARDIRRAFAREYWHPNSVTETVELVLGLVMAPLAVPLAALWFTCRNGPIVRQREGKPLRGQFTEQLRLYFSDGIVGPWYYILSLHRDGARRAPTFLQRCETKRGIFALLRGKTGSPLGEKAKFAERCTAAGVRCVACEMVIGGTSVDAAALPDCDLFVKPLTGSGGSGAERWDRVGPRSWSDSQLVLGDSALVDRLRAKGRPMIVQKRVQSHLALERLTSGATPTVRAVTMIDERGDPELVAAVFRMSFGANRTVDNIHAGGLACAVDLDGGRLGIASNLGSDARLGWTSEHPTTGARIEGTRLPYWDEVKELSVRAHRLFADRLLIGWDVAIAEDGPILIEGNRGPDMDLMQRFMETGFCDHRLGDLIAWHLRARGYVPGTDARAAHRSVVRVDAQ
jgi:Sugar-transfer associated ATP-grasp